MSQIGMGVMIRMMGGNTETVEAYHVVKGKRVIQIEKLDDTDIKGEWESCDLLRILFEDGSRLNIWDGGQSCCEHRYMTIDDDLASYVGATLLDIELRDGPNHSTEYDEHEEQFVVITFGDGRSLTAATHNEHNGYYGGFYIQLAYEAAKQDQ